VQAIRENAGRDNDYSLRFTLEALRKTTQFYSSALLFIPWAGFVDPSDPARIPQSQSLVRSADVLRVLRNDAGAARPLFAAYFLPAAGGTRDRSCRQVKRPAWLLLFFSDLDSLELLASAHAAQEHLKLADDRRLWFRPVAGFRRAHPEIDTYVFDGVPENFMSYGVVGALENIRVNQPARDAWIHDP
jgi:hypothetical protein